MLNSLLNNFKFFLIKTYHEIGGLIKTHEAWVYIADVSIHAVVSIINSGPAALGVGEGVGKGVG